MLVLDHFFNLTKKSNLISRIRYYLTQFFDNLGVAYFFGPPCNRSSLTISKDWFYWPSESRDTVTITV